MVNGNSHEAHYRTFHIPLFLPPSHHSALTYLQYLFSYWHKTPSFTATQNDRNNFSCIDENVKHTKLNGSKYCLNLLFFTPPPQIMVLLTFCQNLTCLKQDLQQSDSGTSQAMVHNIQTARHMTIWTVQNPFSQVQLWNCEYLFHVNNTQQKYIHLTPVPWLLLDLPFLGQFHAVCCSFDVCSLYVNIFGNSL